MLENSEFLLFSLRLQNQDMVTNSTLEYFWMGFLQRCKTDGINPVPLILSNLLKNCIGSLVAHICNMYTHLFWGGNNFIGFPPKWTYVPLLKFTYATVSDSVSSLSGTPHNGSVKRRNALRTLIITLLLV